MLFTASSFFFLPSCASLFSAFPDYYYYFFATTDFAYSRLFSAHCAHVLPQQKCKHVRSAVLETWMAASERRGRIVVVRESRPGRVRRCGRDLGCSRGAREREVWSRVETWMQGASKCENLLETWMQPASECENLLETCTSRPGCNQQASAKICSRPVRRDLDGSSAKSASALQAAHAKKT
jgi:hypothetical protein